MSVLWFALIVDCRNAFALITKRIGEKERMYAFCIIEQVADSDKEDFLTCLSKAICSNMCRTDYVRFWQVMCNVYAIDFHDLNIMSFCSVTYTQLHSFATTTQDDCPVCSRWLSCSVRPIPCWRPIPDTIGCSCTDTDIDTGNDITYSLGHAYVTHVVHSVCTFQNIMSLTLCLQTYVRHAYAGIAY